MQKVAFSSLIVVIIIMLVFGMCGNNVIAEAADAGNVAYSSSGLWTDYASKKYDSGKGTKTDPYVIKSAEQLAKMAVDINSDNQTGTNAYYILKKDIDLKAHDWVPIGTYLDWSSDKITRFYGSFDGNGHTISNMHILADQGYSYYGLFGESSAIIKNLILKDAVIDFICDRDGWQSSNGMGDSIYVGGICGYSSSYYDYDSAIQNCKVENICINVYGKVSITVGGAIGVLNYSKMNSVEVTGSVSGATARALWVGGATGDIANETVVENCSFKGKVSSKNSGWGTGQEETEGLYYLHYVGGFSGCVGRANFNITIKNCYAWSDIYTESKHGSQDAGLFAGAIGIIYDWGLYENLVCKGTITAVRSDETYSENSFWQGECGFSSSNKICEYKNCVVVTDTYVENNYKEKKADEETQTYYLDEMTYKEIFKDALGFDDEIWLITDDDLPVFKKCAVHKYTITSNVSATCTKAGFKTYLCSCGDTYTETFAAHGHDYSSIITKATLTKNGGSKSECLICGDVKSTTIYKPTSFKLSTKEYTYNGKVKTPSVTVKDSEGNTLKKDTDYTVKYESGRKLPGKYTVTITFKGNYSGTKKLVFTIAPRVTSKITATQTIKTITLKWNKVTGADGYRIYKYNAKTKSYEKYKNVTGTSLKLSELKAGTTYKFKVKAYTKDSETVWGKASEEFVTATKTKTPSIKSLKSTAKGKAVIKWSDVSGESGYQVYYSTSKNGSYKTLGSYKSNQTTATKSKLTSGKTYYFKVRAYTKTDSGTVYSAWSSVKSVKIK